MEFDFPQYLKGREMKCFYQKQIRGELAHQENTTSLLLFLEFFPNVKRGKGNYFTENTNMDKLSRPQALLTFATYKSSIILQFQRDVNPELDTL